MRPLISAIFAASLLASAPVAVAKDRQSGEDKLAKMLEGRVAGEARDCINLPQATSSQIVDKTAIVYRIGSTLWVNRPRNGADSLDDYDNILVTKLNGSQLCSIDTIELRDRSTHMYSGFVSLGEFVPYRKVDTAAK